MKAAVLYGKDDIRYEEVRKPVIEKDNDVLVKVKACGVCKSDVPRVNNGTAKKLPLILGHEFAGIVEDVGSNIKDLAAGDHVAGIPLMPCFECENCKAGNYSLCKNYSFVGSRRDGAYAEYILLPRENIIKLDKAIPFVQAALIETAAVALHAFYAADFKAERAENVAVLGIGTIGAFAVQWAKILGAKNIVVFGRNEDRLMFSKELGATHTVNTNNTTVKHAVEEITAGKGFDYVFETAGAVSTIKNCFELAANKASVCLIGTPSEDITFDWQTWELINRKEFNLTGSWMGYSKPFPGREWTETIECMKDGRLKFDEKLLHSQVELPEMKSVFEDFKTKRISGRVMIVNG